MNAELLLDTDVLVDFLRGRAPARALVTSRIDRIALSSIVVAELYAGAREEELDDLDAFVGLFPVIAVDATLARAAGRLCLQYHRSHGTSLNDAVVAATAQQFGLALVTLNARHYPMFHGLRPPYRK